MALQCYDCTGTEDFCKKSTLESNRDKYLKTCPVRADRCYRYFLKKDSATSVIHGCTDQLGCSLLKTTCDDYEDKDITCKIGCCYEDACNMSSRVSFNVILLTVCSVLGLALLM